MLDKQMSFSNREAKFGYDYSIEFTLEKQYDTAAVSSVRNPDRCNYCWFVEFHRPPRV